MATSHLAYEEKRRSIRIDQTILLTVRGMDAFRAPYVEMVPTLTLSCHGCRYRSKHEVILGNLVLLELGGPKQVGLDSTQARVKWLKETKVGEERIGTLRSNWKRRAISGVWRLPPRTGYSR